MTQRTERIDALLREEIGSILERDLADPAIGFTTVTDVETAPDLSQARVWVSVIGQPDEREASLAALRRAMPYVRHLLGARVRLRRIPELHLRLDETSERGTRILQLLSELEAGETPEAEPLAAESLPTPVPRLPHQGDAEGLTGGAVPGSAAASGETSAAPGRRRDPRAGRDGGQRRGRSGAHGSADRGAGWRRR
ncbi:MAG TPA: 30S ribosome-binding factor RbfA [Candidatus Binatus sp.]|nr:30S ribosome-binding factor RbfA [Candidatus Binatus sp.]